MQWSIGFCNADIRQVIKEKKSQLSFKWLPLANSSCSIADPFIFKDVDGKLNLLYEDFSMTNPTNYGKIVLSVIDKDFSITSTKKVLDIKSHSSYPFIFTENGSTYIIPETSSVKKVSIFEYNFNTQSLTNEKVLLNNLPLLDSTIFKYNSKYWLFATLAENGFDHSHLHIYYSDSLSGNYQPHKNNPVKINLDGSRPAGNIIVIDNEIYRPAQNCSIHYGESISINRVTQLSENEFEEEFYFKLFPDKSSTFNAGVHTLNVVDDVIVIDGIKMLFKPWLKWKLFLQKKIKNTSH